jgi:hypothetical protein
MTRLLAAALAITALPLCGAAAAQTAPAPAGVRVRPVPVGVPVDPAIPALQAKALADDTAFKLVEGLTTEIGARPDGSEALGRARDWAVAHLKALGFSNVHIEPYDLRNTWQRGAETAEIVAPAPQTLRLAALGNSAATPAGGLTAPVVFFAGINDLVQAPAGSLRGKIAFVSNTMVRAQDGSGYGAAGAARFTGPGVAAQKGAAAIVIRSIGTDHGRGPHTGVTDFPAGVAPIPAAALSVADAEQLERLVTRGPVTMHLTLTPRFIGTQPSGNVVAEVPGSDPKAGVVLIGGHLDSWELGTGAIDDGAGVAITTGAAKLLLDRPQPPRRTIRVVWFGDEETGGFGGLAYDRAHAGERHALAAESDFGADRVWRFQTSLPDGARQVGERLGAALVPLGVVRGPGPAHGGEDVGPVMARGVAGVDLNQDGLRYFDVHHTPEDTLDRVDAEQLRQNVAAWATMLAVVADAPEEIGPTAPRAR